MNRLLERTFRALVLLARRRDGLAIGELAEGLALPRSSCSRLVSDLVALGWAERDGPHQRIRLGPGAEALAREHPYRPALLRAAEVPMARVATAHRVDTTLAVIRDGRPLVLVQHQQVSPEVSSRFRELDDPYFGAIGHTLIAHLDWRGRRRIWDQRGPPAKVALWPGVRTWGELNVACAEIRQSGLEVNRPPHCDFVGLAVPISDGESGWAALGLRCPTGSWDKARHVRLLLRLAGTIRRRLAAG